MSIDVPATPNLPLPKTDYSQLYFNQLTNVLRLYFNQNGSALQIVANAVPTNLVFTVANLPSAINSGIGARAFVTDSSVTTFGSIVASGGANKLPIYSDGVDWRIG